VQLCPIEPNHRTAVLLFARSANCEAKHKSFGLARGQAARVHASLRLHTLRVLRQTGLAIFECAEQSQHGKSFGERISSAVASVSDLGFTGVVVVGADTPGLRSSDVIKAASVVEQGENVLGRDLRGGVYLFGINLQLGSGFRQNSFEELPWQLPNLGDAIYEFLQPGFELHRLGDLNARCDLMHLPKGLELVRVLKALFSELQPVFPSRPAMCECKTGFGVSLTYRGPPTVRAAA